MIKIFKNLTTTLIFGIFALNQIQAQSYPWGSYQMPYEDSTSFQVMFGGDLLLSVPPVFDSIVWQTNLGITSGNELRAIKDVSGRVLVKTNNRWSYKVVDFKGIQRQADTLFAPSIEDAVYTWSINGVEQVSPKTNKIGLKGAGTYTVSMQVPFVINNDVVYSYTKPYSNLPGEKIGTATSDPYIINQDLNMFSAAISADSIVWDFNGTRNYNQNNTFYAFENGSGVLYIKLFGLWRRADFTFEGILVSGNQLSANVRTSNAVYNWYKDDVAIPGGAGIVSTGPGLYKLEVSWTPSSTFPGGHGTYTKQINPIINPGEVTDLVVRTGNTFSINPTYSPDSVRWNYYAYTPPTSGPLLSLKAPTLSLGFDAVIRVYAYQNNKVYTQKDIYYKAYDPLEKGSFNNPIDSMFVVKTGTELAIHASFNADSINWTLKDLATNAVAISKERYVNLYKDTDVSVIIKSKGRWLKQSVNFRGILYDSATAALQAPIIKDALYIWYFNGQPTGVTSSSYTPTEPGTYKVLVTWVETGTSNQNGRIEGETKTATYTFVVTPNMVTGLNESTDQNGAALQLYPNPAADFVSVTNVNGSFSYSICSVNGNEVANGQSVANAAIDISNFEAGVYMMIIKTQFSQVTKRIIVK